MRDQDNTYARRPDFVAYNVRESRDGKGHWNRIGAAWRHKDGHGYEINLDSLPVDGRVTLREMREERMQGYEDERQNREEPEPEPEPSRSRGRSR